MGRIPDGNAANKAIHFKQPESADMTQATRVRYTLAFKQEAVRLVEGGQTVAAAARAVGVVDRTLSNWVKAKREGKLGYEDSSPASVEQIEIARVPPSGPTPNSPKGDGFRSKASTAGSPYRDAIERMEDHEIIRRLTAGQFSDEAKPVAEATLRDRGIDPSNPVVPEDQRLPQPTPRKSYLPAAFGVIAAAMAGWQIGVAISGAIGAGIISGLLFLLGWWVGKRLSEYVRRVPGGTKRFLIPVAATVLWLLLFGVIGILARVGSGRFHP